MFSLCKTAILGQHRGGRKRLFHFFFPWKNPPRCCFPLLFLEGRYFLTVFVANLALSPTSGAKLWRKQREKLVEQRQDSPRGAPESCNSGVSRDPVPSPGSRPPEELPLRSPVGGDTPMAGHGRDGGPAWCALIQHESCHTCFPQAGDWVWGLWDYKNESVIDSASAQTSGASGVAQRCTAHLSMREMRVRSHSGEDPLEKEVTAHSSILAWGIPCTRETGTLWFIGSQKNQTWLSD